MKIYAVDTLCILLACVMPLGNGLIDEGDCLQSLHMATPCQAKSFMPNSPSAFFYLPGHYP